MIVGTSNHGTLVNLKFALLRPEKGAKERTDGIGNLGKEYAGGIAQPKLSASPKEPFFLVFLKRKLERVPAAGVEERDFDRRSSIATNKFLYIGVHSGGGLHNELFLFVEEGPLTVFQIANAVPDPFSLPTASGSKAGGCSQNILCSHWSFCSST
ncbi:hypothetical protein ACFE04_019641 [Oxalis oulophora]